ncbi:MAG: hypothetical protein AB1452_01240 [Pseudomonadota bacterium]
MHGALLREFSRRTVARLRAVLPLRVALPHLEPFLAENVAKEARKDALLIERAAAALAAGREPGTDDVRALIEAARAVDREFLARTGRFPLRIEIPYAHIEPLRERRIRRGLPLARRILGLWREGKKLRRALPRAELEQDLRGFLALYCEETAALSRGVHLPALLVPLRERLAAALLRLMRETAADIASHKRG